MNQKDRLLTYRDLPVEQQDPLINLAINYMANTIQSEAEFIDAVKALNKPEITEQDVHAAAVSGMAAIIDCMLEYKLKKGGQ